MALFDVKWFKDTDITAAELEQLTDGSNADSLHTHMTLNYAFDAYDASGGQTFASTPVTINIDTERINTDSSIFVLNSDDSVTVNTDDIFLFIVRVSTDVSSGTSRSTSRIWLEYSDDNGSSWNIIPGSYSYMYNRTANVGDNSCTINLLHQTVSGRRYRIRAARVNGSATITTQVNGSEIVICCLRGMKGEKGDDGNINLASVQTRNTSDFSIPSSYATVPFDVIDIENESSIISADTSSNRINIHEDGFYRIYYNYNINPSSGTVRVDGRVLLNGTTQINGSYSYVEVYGGETHELCQSCIVELSEGDYIEYQLQAASSTNAMADSVFNVHKLEGAKGDQGPQGPPGSGSTITVYDEGSLVDNSVSILDFYDVQINNLGGGHVEIRHPDIPIAQYRCNDTSNINQTTPVPITWNIEDFKDSTIFSHSVTIQPTRCTVLQDGIYEINYNIVGDNASAVRATIRCRIRLNGSSYYDVGEAYSYTRNTTDDKISITSGSFIIKLADGDYIEVMADRQGSASTVNLIARKSFIYMKKIR